MAEDDGAVRGMGEAMKQAEAGMKLFKAEEAVEVDVAGATAFKDEMDAKIAALEEEVKALTGKDNKKARTEKEKEKKTVKDDKQYIDACKIVKGQEPKNGFFVKAAAKAEPAAPAAAAAEPEAAAADADAKKAKDKKPAKSKESAGISREEKDELERLKNQIIEKKKALKEQGMSGGQMNKDEEIVGWVSRMNELKEKENPGGLAAAKEDKKAPKKKKLDSETMAMLETKKKEFEEYTEKLRTEFKYSKKEIAADPDYCDMKAEIAKIESGK